MKKRIGLLFLILAALVVLILLRSCDVMIGGKDSKTGAPATDGSAVNADNGNGADDSNTPRGELSIYPAYIQMPTNLVVYPDVETGQEIDWTSSDTSVATVGPDGMITGVAKGEAVITAAVKGKPSVTATCGVRVVMSTADMAALMAEAGALDGEDVTPPQDVTDEEDTDYILIWEDEPPEELPEGWDEDMPDDGSTDGAAVPTPMRARPGVPQVEFIPAAKTGDQQNNAVALATGKGKSSNPPIGLKPDKGTKSVKPNRKKVKEQLEKGFVWKLDVHGDKTTTGWDYYNSEIPITFSFSGISMKYEGGKSMFGTFEGWANMSIDIDTSNVLKRPHDKYEDPPVTLVWNYKGLIADFDFVFLRSPEDDALEDDALLLPFHDAYKDFGTFTYHNVCTWLNIYDDGSVIDLGGSRDTSLHFVIKVSTFIYRVSLSIENPFSSWMKSVDEKTIKFNGFLHKSPNN